MTQPRMKNQPSRYKAGAFLPHTLGRTTKLIIQGNLALQQFKINPYAGAACINWEYLPTERKFTFLFLSSCCLHS